MTPGDEQHHVTVDHVVQAQFNNRMDARSVIGGGFQILLNGGPVLGEVTLSADGKTAIFAPAARWAPGSTYQVRLRNIKDANGNLMVNMNSTFHTAN